MKVALTIINLLIATLFFSVIYSAANVNVDFDVGAMRSGGMALNGDNLVTTFPVKIKNGGLYPISNVRILFTLSNGSQLVYQHTFYISQIPALKTYDKTFVLSMNLTKIYSKLGSYYIFNRGKFTIHIFITAHYWYMADFTAKYTRNINWNPLIYSFTMYRSEISVNNGTVSIPYFISKLPIPLTARLKVNVMDAHGLLATGSAPVVFAKKSTVSLKLVRNASFLLTHADNWSIHYSLTLNGFAVNGTWEYTWTPPISGLALREQMIDGVPYMVLTFKDNWHSACDVILSGYIEEGNQKISVQKHIFVKGGETATVPLTKLTATVSGVNLGIYVPELGMKTTLSSGEVVP
uniref:Uncharacterized protein n=1 Tax=uncultured euryarchaeote Alv-FOS1 TaxID=337892 RepID=Q3SAB4_9EURY|nr:hypothetical protein [uncultured euryarchaeote Alv-FOS1]